MHKKYHLQEAPMPGGYRVFADRIDVAGVGYRKDAARPFCEGSKQRLSFSRETTNKHDPNAIRVVGHWKGWLFEKARHVGYVPAYYASILTSTGLAVLVKPRLMKTYVGRDGYIEITMQIVGPQHEYELFCSRL